MTSAVEVLSLDALYVGKNVKVYDGFENTALGLGGRLAERFIVVARFRKGAKWCAVHDGR